MDELIKKQMLEEALYNPQQSQNPSMANPQGGLSAIMPYYDEDDEEEIYSSDIQTPNQQIQEEQIYEEAPAEGLSEMSAQPLQRPQRRSFDILPEYNVIANYLDDLSGQPRGTTMNQMINQYKNTIAAADEAAIGDFERERAYQDTRADKAKAEEKAERAYRDARTDKEREYIDKKLKDLQGPAFRAATATAKNNIANKARKLDPETYKEMNDEEIIEDLKLGVEPQKKSGLSFNEQMAKLEREYELKKELAEINNKAKAAKDAAKGAGKMGDAEKKRMEGEADNIKKEGNKLQEEYRNVQKFNANYVKNANKTKKFDEDIADLYKLVKTADDLIGVGIRTRGKNNPDAVKAYQQIKSIITRLNTSMVEFAREAGATGRMFDTKDEKELFLGPMAKLVQDIGSYTTTENDVKETIRASVDSYKRKMQEYQDLLSEMNKNYEDNKNHFDIMQSNFDVKYGLNKKQTPKQGTTQTAAGFKITIK